MALQRLRAGLPGQTQKHKTVPDCSGGGPEKACIATRRPGSAYHTVVSGGANPEGWHEVRPPPTG